MMLSDVPLVVVGLLFFAFIPGFLIVKLWFHQEEFLEKAMLSAVFSIMVSIAVGIFFGYDRAQAARFGGFTPLNVWLGVLVVSCVLLVVLIVKDVFVRRRSLQHSVVVKKKHSSQVIKKSKKSLSRKVNKK